MKNIFLLIYLFVVCFAISSCGQKGPLVLPKKQFDIQVKDKVDDKTNEPQKAKQ